MNKQQTNVENNRKKYTIPSGSAFQLRSRNAIYLSPTNTVKHELSKMIGGYMIRKWGEIKFDKELIDMIDVIDVYIKELMKDFTKNKGSFITEAVPKLKTLKEKGVTDKNRRIDLVHLDTNDWWEWETNKKVKKEKSFTIYI